MVVGCLNRGKRGLRGERGRGCWSCWVVFHRVANKVYTRTQEHLAATRDADNHYFSVPHFVIIFCSGVTA